MGLTALLKFLAVWLLLWLTPGVGLSPAAPAQPDGPGMASPLFELYPDAEIPRPARTPRTDRDQLPQVAIIIDDIGYDKQMAQQFLQLDGPLTFSILPHSPHGPEIARQAHEKGFGIMLHLPMEPREYPQIDPGPGALLTSMEPQELVCQLKKNLAAIPLIAGVNNHMGSCMTARPFQIHQIFSVLKQNRLFFIDSLTTGKSQCQASARILKLPFAHRDVFLDHKLKPALVRKQFEQLLDLAQTYGEAVGIGHPHALTFQVLSQELPKVRQRIRLVPAAEVVHTLG